MNQTTVRTMAILQLIAAHEHGITLQEIANHMGMAKSSASVIVHTLLELNYIQTVENNDKKYCLGVETFTLGMKYVNKLNFVKECGLYLPELTEKYNRTGFVAVLDDTKIVYVYKYKAQRARLATCAIGASKAAYATALGKAIIAFLPPEEQAAVISRIQFKPFTRNTITSPEAFLEEMRVTRARGYSRERGELEELTICYAAPIFDYSGRVIAGISLSDIYDGNDAETESLIRDLLAAAMKISRSLGYSPQE